MIGTIVKKEIASNLLSYKFFIVILLMTVLLSVSFFILYKDFKGRHEDYSLIRPKPGEPIAVLSPNPLSIFAKGLDEAIGRSFEVDRLGMIGVRAGQKSGNAIFAFFPTPDFVYIVKVVLSLIALLFGFDQIAKERENGVLRLMLSNPVSRATILAGKWLGNFLSLAVPFLLISLLGFVLLALDPQIRFGAAGTARFLLIIAVSLLYAALFLSLGILVSALCRRAAVSLVILLFIWAAAIFVVPNLGTLIARQIVEVPSVKSLTEKREQIWTREIFLLEMERQADGARRTGDQAKVHFDAINNEIDQMETDYRLKFDRLVRLSKTINRFSPAACFVYAATGLAGTGIEEESRLKEAVIRYKDSALKAVVWESTEKPPAFSYRYRSIGQVLAGGGIVDAAILLIVAIVLFGWGFAAFLRYDVR